jgi:hypothetical protein
VNKHQLKKLYNEYLRRERLSPSDVVVGFGSALVLMGLRKETSDLDLDVYPAFFELSCKRGYPARNTSIGTCVQVLENVSIRSSLTIYSQLIEGIYCSTAQDLLFAKRQLVNSGTRSPEKLTQDMEDIRNLEKVLKLTPIGLGPAPGGPNDLRSGMTLNAVEELFYERLLRHNWIFRSGQANYRKDSTTEKALAELASKLGGNHLILMNRFRHKRRRDLARTVKETV